MINHFSIKVLLLTVVGFTIQSAHASSVNCVHGALNDASNYSFSVNGNVITLTEFYTDPAHDPYQFSQMESMPVLSPGSYSLIITSPSRIYCSTGNENSPECQTGNFDRTPSTHFPDMPSVTFMDNTRGIPLADLENVNDFEIYAVTGNNYFFGGYFFTEHGTDVGQNPLAFDHCDFSL